MAELGFVQDMGWTISRLENPGVFFGDHLYLHTDGKWRKKTCVIGADGTKTYSGYFNSEDEAVNAARAAGIKIIDERPWT